MSGLVLPIIKKKCKILLATLTWAPKKFEFAATFETIATKGTSFKSHYKASAGDAKCE